MASSQQILLSSNRLLPGILLTACLALPSTPAEAFFCLLKGADKSRRPPVRFPSPPYQPPATASAPHASPLPARPYRVGGYLGRRHAPVASPELRWRPLEGVSR